jgi:hypothetical protein
MRCVVVDRQLEQADPAAFGFLIGFARDNELKLRPGRGEKRPDNPAAGEAAQDGAAAGC